MTELMIAGFCIAYGLIGGWAEYRIWWYPLFRSLENHLKCLKAKLIHLVSARSSSWYDVLTRRKHDGKEIFTSG